DHDETPRSQAAVIGRGGSGRKNQLERTNIRGGGGQRFGRPPLQKGIYGLHGSNVPRRVAVWRQFIPLKARWARYLLATFVVCVEGHYARSSHGGRGAVGSSYPQQRWP